MCQECDWGYEEIKTCKQCRTQFISLHYELCYVCLTSGINEDLMGRKIESTGKSSFEGMKELGLVGAIEEHMIDEKTFWKSECRNQREISIELREICQQYANTIRELTEQMDKLIAKVSKDVSKNDKKKAKKDIKILKKADKVQDRKVESYEKMKKRGC